MRHFAVSAIGRDRPGIVAALSEALLAHEGNIEDSHMRILQSHFTVMLIVSTPDQVDDAALRGALEDAARRLDLEAVSLSQIAEEGPLNPAGAEPSHVVRVRGADHPGIVHDVAATLAQRDVNITNLTTRLIEDEAAPVYAMTLEIALPPYTRIEEVGGALREVGKRQGVELAIEALERRR